MFRKKILVIGVGALSFFALSVSLTRAASDEGGKAAQKPAAAATKQEAKPEPGTQGVRAFIDPATGKLREPDPSETRQLAPAAAAATTRALKAAAPLRGPRGAVGMKVDESQMMYSVATKNADGSISFQCVRGESAASKVVSGKPSERSDSDVR